MNIRFTGNPGDAMFAGESLDHIKAVFSSEYEKAGYSKEMAVFIRHESEGRLHCEVEVYFSPASIVAAEAVDATPCKRPSSEGLSLLAGSELSWSVFFAGRQSP
ncbi:MAG: hypothetical protein WBO37_12615 [Gammaproteobacteria bacterium]